MHLQLDTGEGLQWNSYIVTKHTCAGWRIIREGEESDDSSSDEDW